LGRFQGKLRFSLPATLVAIVKDDQLRAHCGGGVPPRDESEGHRPTQIDAARRPIFSTPPLPTRPLMNAKHSNFHEFLVLSW